MQWNTCANCSGITVPVIQFFQGTAQSFQVIKWLMWQWILFPLLSICAIGSRKNTHFLVCHFQSLIHNFSCKRRVVIAPRIKVSKNQGLENYNKSMPKMPKANYNHKKFFVAWLLNKTSSKNWGCPGAIWPFSTSLLALCVLAVVQCMM